MDNSSQQSTVVAKNYLHLVRQRVHDSLSVKQALADNSDLLARTAEVGEIISEALRYDHKVLLFGNGGSAADAQHLAAEFVGRYQRERRALPALALTDNSSSMTAIGNDCAFDFVFSRQVEALGLPGDIAIGISTSGKSRNVLVALEAAKKKGLKTVGFTGRDPNPMQSKVDYWLAVPSNETPRIQECHILLGHIICEIVERELFDE
jgi:D-sedoheptulose 7-phosphate isomerase